MKRRNFTEKSKTVWNRFATEMVDETLAKMENAMIKTIYDNLYNQWLYDEDVCAKLDENGEAIYDEKEDWTIFDEDAASEIAESMYCECNGFYDKHNNFIELPSRTEMVENLLNECMNGDYVKQREYIKEETWTDTFERMTYTYDTGLEWYLD